MCYLPLCPANLWDTIAHPAPIDATERVAFLTCSSYQFAIVQETRFKPGSPVVGNATAVVQKRSTNPFRAWLR